MSEKNKYLINYSDEHKAGKLAKIVGREDEINRIIHILLRFSKNNPVLIGETGIGKTSMTIGVATKLAQKKAPDLLKGKSIVCIDFASMMINSKTQEEYESSLKEVLQEVISSNGNKILFIKDAQIFNPNNKNSLQISKFLKPKILSGEIRCIILSDISKYKIFIETDIDLMRTVQPVHIEEPSDEETLTIVHGIKDKYEKHFGVVIPNDVLPSVITLTKRYVKQRVFPEKAIDLLDEAASQLLMDIELGKIDKSKNKITIEDVSRVISIWTGVPLDKVDAQDREKLINVEEFLGRRVIGQPDAISVVSNAVRIARSGLQDPGRPIGTFLFIGTTGVGKTELAKALAEFMFDDESSMLRLDMSEYMERSSIARLLGPAPGTPGYEEGGLLTESVRMKPYQVVLFDEIEKAHTEILNLFLQILDEGRLTDSKGTSVDFRNTVVIMTSNIGAHLPSYKRKEYLKEHLKPEILARIDEIVSFYGLTMKSLAKIVNIHLNKLIKRAKSIGIELVISLEGKKWLAERVYSAKNGVRELNTLMKRYIQSPMATMLMYGYIEKGDTIKVVDGTSFGNMNLFKIDKETGEEIPVNLDELELETKPILEEDEQEGPKETSQETQEDVQDDAEEGAEESEDEYEYEYAQEDELEDGEYEYEYEYEEDAEIIEQEPVKQETQAPIEQKIKAEEVKEKEILKEEQKEASKNKKNVEPEVVKKQKKEDLSLKQPKKIVKKVVQKQVVKAPKKVTKVVKRVVKKNK